MAVLWLLPLAVAAVALMFVVAWLTARATVYTITNRRVVMRIGVVLEVTFNLPVPRHRVGGAAHVSRTVPATFH